MLYMREQTPSFGLWRSLFNPSRRLSDDQATKQFSRLQFKMLTRSMSRTQKTREPHHQ